MNYAKESEVNVGSLLEADDGFTCIPNGCRCVVRKDGGGLYIPCADDGGKHYLDGQLDDGDVYIGLTMLPPPKPLEAEPPPGEPFYVVGNLGTVFEMAINASGTGPAQFIARGRAFASKVEADAFAAMEQV